MEHKTQHLTNIPEGNYKSDPASESWDDRTARLLGDDAMKALAGASVLVAGLGGVGGYAAEILVRTGIGRLTIIDADNVATSNINRQLIALRSSVGSPKAILFAERFHDINPEASINAMQMYIDPEGAGRLLDEGYDYVLDCIDTVAPKVALIEQCMRRHIPVISSMGAGGRIDPTQIGYRDLWATRDDGLARAVRQQLKKRGIRQPLMTVSSSERPDRHSLLDVEEKNKRTSYGSLASVPAIFGIFMANYVIRKIINI